MGSTAKSIEGGVRAKALGPSDSGLFHRATASAANDDAQRGERERVRSERLDRAAQAFDLQCRRAFSEAMSSLAGEAAYSNRAVAERMHIDEKAVRAMRAGEKPCSPNRVMCGGERLWSEFLSALARAAKGQSL